MRPLTPSPEHRRSTRTGDPLDLADPLFHLASESRESLAHLAQHEPVRWNPGAGSKGFWAVTGHAEARGVLIDPETFSSDWRLGGFRIFDLQEVSALPRPTLLSLDGQQHLEFPFF